MTKKAEGFAPCIDIDIPYVGCNYGILENI